MPAPFNAPLSPGFTLTNGYTVRVSAQNPANGNTVGGVIASNVSISVGQEDVATTETQTPGQIFLLPGPAVAA